MALQKLNFLVMHALEFRIVGGASDKAIANHLFRESLEFLWHFEQDAALAQTIWTLHSIGSIQKRRHQAREIRLPALTRGVPLLYSVRPWRDRPIDAPFKAQTIGWVLENAGGIIYKSKFDESRL